MRRLFVARIQRWYIIFAVGVFFSLAMISGCFQPVINYFTALMEKPQPIFHGNPAEPKVALACNVFWGEEFLPDMLKTLESSGVKITFFIGGSWAKRYPDMVGELAKRGHELANHSYSHPHPNTLNLEKNKEQIVRTEELVKELSGVKTTLYAPPYGEYNDTVLSAADQLGYTTIMWSIDTVDWKRPPPDIIVNRVVKKLHNGAIILIHPTEPTAKALSELIRQITAGGYMIVPVSEILSR